MCRNLTASHSTAVILQPTRLWWFQRVVLDADKSDLRLSRAVNDFSEKKKKKANSDQVDGRPAFQQEKYQSYKGT
jgi:hypothetical protein